MNLIRVRRINSSHLNKRNSNRPGSRRSLMMTMMMKRN